MGEYSSTLAAVAEAELVDVASLAGAAVDDEGRGEERRSASGQRE